MYTTETLLFLRNSPFCRTPPAELRPIPGITAPLDENDNKPKEKVVCI